MSAFHQIFRMNLQKNVSSFALALLLSHQWNNQLNFSSSSSSDSSRDSNEKSCNILSVPISYIPNVVQSTINISTSAPVNSLYQQSLSASALHIPQSQLSKIARQEFSHCSTHRAPSLSVIYALKIVLFLFNFLIYFHLSSFALSFSFFLSPLMSLFLTKFIFGLFLAANGPTVAGSETPRPSITKPSSDGVIDIKKPTQVSNRSNSSVFFS